MGRPSATTQSHVVVRTAAPVAAIVAAMLLTLTSAIGQAGAVPVGAGYRDHSYDAASVDTPSQDKPQSKVWFTDGFWWAGMMDPESGTNGDYRIYRYDASAHTWSATATVLDVRNSSHADYLWDAGTNSLYVASVLLDSGGGTDPILVYKLNYNPGTNTYAHDPDFGSAGVQVGVGPAETVTIAKDSTGQLWVAYDNPVGAPSTDRSIMINRSVGDEHSWGTPFALDTAGESDLGAIIAFGGNAVGVMWSDERPDLAGHTHFYWASHADAADDTTWSAKQSAASGASGASGQFAEDHINLKTVAPGSGEILAAVKTNNDPDRIQLLRRDPGTGNWSVHLVVGQGLDVTRPQVVIDATNDLAYVFYTSPESFSAPNATIYYKSAPLEGLAFTTSGLGTPFVQESNVRITDVSTSKHPVTEEMGGILGIASGDNNEAYYHGWISLVNEPPFTDIDSSAFKADIIWAWENGITTGCTATLFCPNSAVTRAQMASFLVRALHLAPSAQDFFTDDGSSVHQADINALANAGITTGCTATTYCPTAPVTRAQMASFLVRAYELAASSTDFFTDDDASIHESDINALADAGVTTGCTATTYCPTAAVTRGQMTAFLHRAANLEP